MRSELVELKNEIFKHIAVWQIGIIVAILKVAIKD